MSSADLFFGCVGGFVGQILCYPFDTIKSRYQKLGSRYSIFSDIRRNGYLQLYRGITSPLLSVVLENPFYFVYMDGFAEKQQERYFPSLFVMAFFQD